MISFTAGIFVSEAILSSLDLERSIDPTMLLTIDELVLELIMADIDGRSNALLLEENSRIQILEELLLTIRDAALEIDSESEDSQLLARAETYLEYAIGQLEQAYTSQASEQEKLSRINAAHALIDRAIDVLNRL